MLSYHLSNEEVHRPWGERNLNDEKNTRPDVNFQHLIYPAIASDVADNRLSVLLLLSSFLLSSEIIASLTKQMNNAHQYIIYTAFIL